jgi:type II secretory pathway component PulF
VSNHQPKSQIITANKKVNVHSVSKNNIQKTNTKPKSKQRKIAILTGVSLVLMALVAALTVPPLAELFIGGNSALTAANVTSNFSKYARAVIGWVAIFFLDILVAIGVYKYYKKEKPKLATTTSLLRIIYTAILGVGIVQLLLVTPKSSALTIYNNINSFNKLWGIGLIVFGIHLIALGVLFKNEGGKKWVTTTIKTLLIIAGIGYTLQYAGILLVANPVAYAKLMQAIFLVPMILGELSYAIWKIIKGGKQSLNTKTN